MIQNLSSSSQIPKKFTPRSRLRSLSLSLATMFAMVLVAPLAILPAGPAAANIEQPTIEVVSDGDRTTSPVLDNDLGNGIVGTNDTVCYRWSFATTGVTDASLSQVLPAGWVWTEASLTTLSSNSDLYESSYVITGDVATGQTLAATISVPDGQSIILLGPLCAVPGPTAATTGYTAVLGVDAEGEQSEAEATEVTVVGIPKIDVSKYLYRPQALSAYDFGGGLEPAMSIDFRIAVQLPEGDALYGATPVLVPEPFTLSDVFGLDLPVNVELELVEATSGTPVLSGSDIVVTGASDVGVLPWGVTVRMWFPHDELPTPGEDPAFLTITNTAELVSDDIVDEDPSNNTATGTVQGSPDGTGVLSGKEIFAADDPDNPQYNVDPLYGTNTQVTSGIVSTDAIIFSRFYVGLRDLVSNAVTPMTRPVAFDFWDPTLQQLTGDDGDIYVGNSPTAPVPTSDYVITYTTSDGTNVDPETLTWFPRTDPAFDPATARGIRVQYIGDGSPGAQYLPAWFLVGVPFEVVADPGVILSDTAKFAVPEVPDDPGVPSWTRTVTTSTHILGITKSVDLPATTSGSTLTYTVSPTLSVPTGTTTPSTVTGLQVVDTLPPSIVSVDTSGVDPDWTVQQTPGDPGPDGIPGTSDDVSGIVLEFSYLNGAEVTTDDAIAPIVFEAQTSPIRPASGTVLNTAIVSADQNHQAESVRSATAITAIVQADVLAKSKVVDDPLIEVREPQVSWTSSWFNFQTTDQGQTSFVDVLPHNGDGRGTDFHGTATLAQVIPLGPDVANYTIEYTTDAPATIGAAPSSSSTWLAAPISGDFTGITGVTAVRVTMPVFKAGEEGVGGLRVILDVFGQLEDDVYANTIGGRINIDPTDPTQVRPSPTGLRPSSGSSAATSQGRSGGIATVMRLRTQSRVSQELPSRSSTPMDLPCTSWTA